MTRRHLRLVRFAFVALITLCMSGFPALLEAADSAPSMTDLTNGLVLHYTFDSDEGSVVTDQSGTGNDGQVQGPAWTADSALGSGAMSLDGSDDRISVAESSTLELTNVSVTAWIKTSNGGSGIRCIVSKQEAYSINVKDNVFGTFDWSGPRFVSTGTNVADGTWHHVALVAQTGAPEASSLYVDGHCMTSFSYSVIKPARYALAVGAAYANVLGSLSTEYFSGLVDDVRVYGRPLSSNEVHDLYLAGANFETAELVIAGAPSEQGAPEPYGYGTNVLAVGTSVVVSVTSPADETNGQRYVCTGWTGTGDVPASGTSNEVSFTLNTGSTLTWQWQKQYLLSVSAGAHGRVDEEGGWYDESDVVQLTATASNGYTFTGWTGDVPAGSETNNPLSVTMDQARSVTAGFSELVSEYTIVTGSFSWHEAKAHAEGLGGHLATVTSEDEWIAVSNFLGSEITNRFWLGATDEDVEGEWRWVTGEAWDYERWNDGQPNNELGSEHYLILEAHTFWNDGLPAPFRLSHYLLETAAPTGGLSHGLVLHYTFDSDEGSVVTDQSVLALDGVVHGSAWTAESWLGSGAMSFDGTDDYVEVADHGVSFSNGWTTMAWVNLKASGWDHYVWCDRHGKDERPWGGLFIDSSDRCGAGVWDEAGITVRADARGATAISTGEWTHVAAVWDQGSHIVRVYVNGQFEGADTNMAITNVCHPSADFHIGQNWSDNNTRLRGLMDELKVYNRPLSNSEILTAYNAGNGLVLHYTFDSDEGSVVTDQSGTGNDGDVQGAAWTTDAVLGDGAMSLDGADDRISLGESATLDLSNLTVAAWIKTSNAGSGIRCILSKQEAYSINMKDNAFGTFDWSGPSFVSSGTNVADGTWHHVGLTVRSGETNGSSLYVDGGCVTSFTYSVVKPARYPPAVGAAYPSSVARPNTENFAGLVDDVRVYGRPLSPDEVHDLYLTGWSAQTAALVIAGAPSEQGVPAPYGYGTNVLAMGTSVVVSVASPADETNGQRYVCTGWTGTGDVPASGTSNEVSFTLNSDSTLTWQWQKQYLLRVTAGAHGNVDEEGGWYDESEVVQLTATASNGYTFTGWTGDVPAGSETNNPLSVTMDQARSVVADFADVTAPADVTSFVAILGNAKVTLSWVNPADADFAGVRIQRETGEYPSDPDDGTTVYDGPGTNTMDTGLENGTAYYYKAFSYDGVTNFADGVEASATPENPRRPTLSWAAVEGATWYFVWINDSSGLYYRKWLNQTNTSWTADFDFKGGDYQWWVKAWGPTIGLGEWSAASTFSIAVMIPGKTTCLAPHTTISTNLPEFCWSAVEDVAWYCLLVHKDGTQLVKQWLQGETNYTPETELAFGEYEWWVRTWNVDGFGDWSDAASFTYGCPEPLSPTGELGSVRCPEFTWTSVPDAEWYCLKVDLGGTNVIQEWVSGATNWTPAEDLAGGAYEWWVKAWKPGGSGPWSTGLTFSIDVAVPAKPIPVSPLGTEYDDDVDYTWEADAAATYYQLWIARDGVKWLNRWYAMGTGETGRVTRTVSGHVTGSTYTWWVRGWSPDGYSDWSDGAACYVNIPPDADSDGLPDWWETLFFKNKTNALAAADSDGDRLSNLAEYLAGTCPTNAADCLKLADPTGTSTPGKMVITWPTVTGRTYHVYSAADLGAGWSAVYETEGDGSQKSFTADCASVARCFLQVGADRE